MVEQVYWDDWLNDSLSERGASAIKDQIEDFWRERGYSVQVYIEKKGFVPTLRGAHWVVRSNLVNGLPRPAAIEDRRAA